MPTGYPDYFAQPAIAAKQDLIAQAAAIAATTLFNTGAAGFYRFSASVFLNDISGGNDSVNFQVTWVQNAGTIASVPVTASFNGVGVAVAWGVIPFFADANSAIKFVTGFAHGAGDTYDLHMRLEAMDQTGQG